jgi:hypothetical protein
MDPHKIRHDRKVRACTFEVGDFVWVRDTTTTKGKIKKLSARWKGPYVVITKISEAVYKLKNCETNRSITVNKCRLQRCFPKREILGRDGNELETGTEITGEYVEKAQETGSNNTNPTPTTPTVVTVLAKKTRKMKKKKQPVEQNKQN